MLCFAGRRIVLFTVALFRGCFSSYLLAIQVLLNSQAADTTDLLQKLSLEGKDGTVTDAAKKVAIRAFVLGYGSRFSIRILL